MAQKTSDISDPVVSRLDEIERRVVKIEWFAAIAAICGIVLVLKVGGFF